MSCETSLPRGSKACLGACVRGGSSRLWDRISFRSCCWAPGVATEPEDRFYNGAAPLKLDSEEKMLGGKRFGRERGSVSLLTVLWINGCTLPTPVCWSDRVIVGSYKALGGLAWFGVLNMLLNLLHFSEGLKGGEPYFRDSHSGLCAETTAESKKYRSVLLVWAASWLLEILNSSGDSKGWEPLMKVKDQ